MASATSQLSSIETKTFDLTDVTRKDSTNSTFNRASFIFVTAICLLASIGFFWSAVTGQVNPAFSVLQVYGLGAFALAPGLFFAAVLTHQYRHPGYARAVVTSSGVDFEWYHDRGRSELRWDHRPLYLRIARDQASSGDAVNFYDLTDAWANRPLTEETVQAIVESARSAGLRIEQKPSWGGVRTNIIVRTEDGTRPAP